MEKQGDEGKHVGSVSWRLHSYWSTCAMPEGFLTVRMLAQTPCPKFLLVAVYWSDVVCPKMMKKVTAV
jgi:hypothetical protein